MQNLSFFSEDTPFEIKDTEFTIKWIERLISSHNKITGEISYIFCSDSYLLKINQEHLNHDTLTDIITFDYTQTAIISGDIFISINRVEENANTFGVSFMEELHRVMSHGILHLIGFNDKSSSEKKEMRKEEDKALSLLKTLS